MASKTSTILAIAFSLIKAAVVFGIIATILLYFAQDSIVYHPHAYARPIWQEAGRKIAPLTYETGSGKQTAFYLPPKDGGPPNRIWIMFGGNGALILDYADTLPMQPLLANEGFLMIDYPGYGLNEGKPSAESIQESANGAVAALSNKLGLDEKTVLLRSGLVGHSLGTGAALEFAAAHPEISRIVLAAPFTSLYAMAYRMAGPVAHLLHHNFDNEGVLTMLGQRSPRPTVVIFTGDRDQIIPVAAAGAGKFLADIP